MESQQSSWAVVRGTIAARLVGVAMAAAAVALIGVVTEGKAPRPVPATEATAQPTPASGSQQPGTITRFQFDETPQQITVGEGAAYTILGTSEPYELVRIDARTLRVSKRTLPGIHFAVTAGGGALWVSSCEGDRFAPCQDSWLLKLNPATLRIVARLPMAEQIIDLEMGDGALWVDLGGSREGTLLRLDPQTNEAISAFFPVRIGMMAIGGGSVWITDLNAGAVFRYDGATGREIARVSVPRKDPCWLAADETAAWVTSCLGEDQLSRIDPATNRVVDRISFAGSVTITVSDSYLLMVTTSTREPYTSVRRLDPATNTFVGQPITIPDDPAAGPRSNCEHLGFAEPSWAGVREGAIWVTSCRDAEVVRFQL